MGLRDSVTGFDFRTCGVGLGLGHSQSCPSTELTGRRLKLTAWWLPEIAKCRATTVFERTGFNSALLSMTVVPTLGGCANTEAEKFQYVDVFLSVSVER